MVQYRKEPQVEYRGIEASAQQYPDGEFRVVLSGEYRSEPDPYKLGWVRFGGRPDLMRISFAVDYGPDALVSGILALQDAAPGANYYDWSFIRDSSEAAIVRMDSLARDWHKGEPFPWQLPSAQAAGKVEAL